VRYVNEALKIQLRLLQKRRKNQYVQIRSQWKNREDTEAFDLIYYVSYLSLALQKNEAVFAEEAQKHRNGRTILTHKF
jgi:hypothetical protein